MIQNRNHHRKRVFSFSSQHQPPRRCGATSINGHSNGALAAVLGAVELVNPGAAKGREGMAVPATTTNATINTTPGSPPASAVSAPTAAAANDDDKEDNSVNLDMLRRRVRNLFPMLNVSADRLADAEANAAVARVECARTLELAERRAGERIHQVEEELRRMRIKAERFRAGWMRLRPAVGGRGRKRRAKGAEASSAAAAAAKADNAPPPVAFWGAGRESASPPLAPPPTPPSIVVVTDDPRWDGHRGGR